MHKRFFLAGFLSLPFLAKATTAEAANSTNWRVPKNVKRVRVQSWTGTDKVMDYYFDVKPGQLFRVEVAD